jgi:hypothetical protein
LRLGWSSQTLMLPFCEELGFQCLRWCTWGIALLPLVIFFDPYVVNGVRMMSVFKQQRQAPADRNNGVKTTSNLTRQEWSDGEDGGRRMHYSTVHSERRIVTMHARVTLFGVRDLPL